MDKFGSSTTEIGRAIGASAMEANRLPGVVRIVGRLPNSVATPTPGKKGVYPPCASDFYKLLRERDVDVRFEHEKQDREYLSLHSAELWLPVLEIGGNILLAFGGSLFSDLVKDWLMLKKQPAEETTLHVEFSVAKDGSVHEFKADGKGVDVLRAMEEFEEKWK
ncbi:MAG: hypothetical protein ABWX63_04920 [Paeniglutamicibacter terrestris]